MDFITSLPRSHKQNDSIYLIIDRITKSSHLLPLMTTHSSKYYNRIYIQEVVGLLGVLVSIISDRGAQLVAQFLKSFQKGLGSKVNLSTIFHPRNDGQVECTIENLE